MGKKVIKVGSNKKGKFEKRAALSSAALSYFNAAKNL